MSAKPATSVRKKVTKKQPIVYPEYSAKQLCNALVRLGFQKKKSNNHQHKFKHPTREANWGNRACVVFPEDIGKRKRLQQIVIKQISANFGYAEEEVIAQIK